MAHIVLVAVLATTALFITNPFSDDPPSVPRSDDERKGLEALTKLPTMCVENPGDPYFISSKSVFASKPRNTPQEAIAWLLEVTTKGDFAASHFEPVGREAGSYILVESGVIRAKTDVEHRGERWTANGLQVCETA